MGGGGQWLCRDFVEQQVTHKGQCHACAPRQQRDPFDQNIGRAGFLRLAIVASLPFVAHLSEAARHLKVSAEVTLQPGPLAVTRPKGVEHALRMEHRNMSPRQQMGSVPDVA